MELRCKMQDDRNVNGGTQDKKYLNSGSEACSF